MRVLGSNLKGKGAMFLAGIEWAVEHGMDVVNMSLSSKSDAMFAALHDVADEAFFGGSVLVCAANNVPGPTYPSQFASVVSVAARVTGDPLSLAYNPTHRSSSPPAASTSRSPGPEVSIVATGNSFATPHVAGMAALIRSAAPWTDAVPGQSSAPRDQRERGSGRTRTAVAVAAVGAGLFRTPVPRQP